MTRRLLLASFVAALAYTLGPTIVHAATCTGANPCGACKNCTACAHCKKRGGTCGVCRKKTTSAAESK